MICKIPDDRRENSFNIGIGKREKKHSPLGVAGILNIQETPGHSPIRDDVYTVDSIPSMYVGLD